MPDVPTVTHPREGAAGVSGDGECFRWPRVSEAVIERIVEMLRAGDTSFDEALYEDFETDVAHLFGVRHALSCSNGTSACYSAFRALGIGPGDTVIAPAISHWAAVLPALQCGAHVALADVRPDTCHLDPEAAARLIDSTTRAIVVNHMFGEASRLDEVRSLCDAHGLALVEDVSHAHGARFRGRPAGSFGDVSFCSFQASKLVSGGEGGALLTDRPELFYEAMALGHPRRLRRAPAEWQALSGTGRGFKFRPSPLLVAIAHDSLRRLGEQNEIRRQACGLLRSILAESPDFAGLGRSAEGRVFYRCELLLAPAARRIRDRLVAELHARGVRAHRVVGYLPGHPSLDGRTRPGGPWPAATDVMERVFFVEAFTAWSAPVVERHARIILETLRELRDA